LIALSFRPLQGGLAVVVRGAHFRICSDGTLRGPDNTTSARYLGGLWHLGHRRHISFESAGPVYLRVTTNQGRRECIGPYASIRAADGAIFAHNSCLGVHVARDQFGADTVEMWQEVSFLTSI
jgi:hypothetical protein